jgi:uncharacterized protein (DUF58 family)
MLWLAPRGVLLLIAAAVAAFALAGVAPAWIAAVVPLALVAALVLADVLALRAPIEVERLAPPRLALARRDVFRYAVRNRARDPRFVALVEAPAERLAIDVDEVHALVPARAAVELEIGVLPRERGRTALRSFSLRLRTPFGLVERRRTVAAPVPLRVMPDLSALDRSGDPVARAKLIEAGLRRLRRRGAGGEFATLREYGPDDEFRSIDWKASARRGRTMVAQYEVERSQQIVVALDAGRLMTARLGDRRKLDYAVSAALAIAAIARLAADRVGVLAFAGRVLARVAPGAGAAHAARLTDVLSDLEPHLEEADYERAFIALGREVKRRSLIVLFTDLFDPVASSAVLAATRILQPRHLVLVVLMNDAAIETALVRAPSDVEDAYRAAVAVTLADERTRALGALRDRGILVVDVPAAELTIALLDAYVDVKSRGLL